MTAEPLGVRQYGGAAAGATGPGGPLGELLSHGDPAGEAGWEEHPRRVGFFTDTSICIGCKACEVACKEWNEVPEDGLNWSGRSHDNSGGLGADTWRHVAFVEQRVKLSGHAANFQRGGGGAAAGGTGAGGTAAGGTGAGGAAAGGTGAGGTGAIAGAEDAIAGDGSGDFRWLMASDVCKHCTDAACLDVCPTGSIFRTEFGTVVVQADICNGCGYCVPACPYGVLNRREGDGRIFKCTLCYDRLQIGEEPACAKACPTESIQFGELDELRVRAGARVEELHARGVSEARLYGEDPENGVGGDGAFFLLLDEPEVYGLPPAPVVTTRDLGSIWRHVGVAAGALAGVAVAAFAAAGKAR